MSSERAAFMELVKAEIGRLNQQLGKRGSVSMVFQKGSLLVRRTLAPAVLPLLPTCMLAQGLIQQPPKQLVHVIDELQRIGQGQPSYLAASMQRRSSWLWQGSRCRGGGRRVCRWSGRRSWRRWWVRSGWRTE